MSYRNGTYIAFDGQGEINHALSDIRYYNIMKAWNENSNINFVNSHDKSGKVRDSSLDETLKRSLRTRMDNSKQILIIISDDTRKNGSMLDYEIEIAVKKGIPFIIAYVGVEKVDIHGKLKHKLPIILQTACDNSLIDALHIPFKKNKIHDALQYMSVHNQIKKGSYLSYEQ